MVFGNTYRGKRVLVTGHTGFKGAWLSEWLVKLGAEVTGIALSPPTEPALFNQLGLVKRMSDRRGDIRDLEVISRLVSQEKPAFIFHLAAQPLVRLSYQQPVETYATNVMGTVNVLEAVRRAERPCVVVAVTTDKCYENREWLHSYREEDPLGGYDPYSSSKGATELAIAGYRRSFFSKQPGMHVVSARAGNVIGGGDWALDRIVPDCIRSLRRGEPIPVRNRLAKRPWQHVLEPLSGYLWLAARLTMDGESDKTSNGAFNFGPALGSNRTVAELVEEVLKHWPGTWDDRTDPKAVHEATLLNLSIDKAFHTLKWHPVWSFAPTIARTVDWYREVSEQSAVASEYTLAQIAAYETAAREQQLAWAIS